VLQVVQVAEVDQMSLLVLHADMLVPGALEQAVKEMQVLLAPTPEAVAVVHRKQDIQVAVEILEEVSVDMVAQVRTQVFRVQQ
jgi:hypothetical protein